MDSEELEFLRWSNQAKWERSKAKRASRLEAWAPDGRWTQKGPHMWVTSVCGRPLKYWPSTGSFAFDGIVHNKVVNKGARRECAGTRTF